MDLLHGNDTLQFPVKRVMLPVHRDNERAG